MSGLNLVLKTGVPMCDPCSAKITYLDKWTTISRLPQEYWEGNLLAPLLSGVGVFLKADEYTLTGVKGNFVCVCLNVDVTKLLRGTLIIPSSDALPISYEVSAICGSTAHALEACPDSPKNVFEMVVEKFGAATLQAESVSSPLTCDL